MSDAPDPMGKRALFWAPASRDEDAPLKAARDAPGKHALFSDEARIAPVLTGPGRRIAARAANDKSRRAAERDLDAAPARPGGATGFLPAIDVTCSSCGESSSVDVLEFAVLHLPLWFWRPGRGYTRFMTCPACRRRTWVSTSWSRAKAFEPARDAG
ncbi:MAG TPA: hypothetical protein VKU86_10325 [Acidimicrobiales bacterium]|nr:hypothetical protein [Acidimicrobiales bacterium]